MSPLRPVVVLIVLALAVVACGPSSSSPTTGASAGASAGATASPSVTASPSPQASRDLVPLTVGLGFIPSVQFAPFYLADQAGYYADAGLTVELQNKIDPDLVILVGQGALDIGLGDGTSVIPAASRGIPVKYVATIYGQFPSIVFAKASSGIASAADLKGKRLGIPGRYGSSWVMLQALLASAGLTPDDLRIVEYPDFGQGAAVTQGAVDAATGFVNNEPVQLRLTGEQVNVLRVDDITPLPGNGLITGKTTLETKSEAIAAFIAATLRAMEDITATPEIGLEAAFKAVPELATQRDTQAAILDATIAAWRGKVQQAHGLGAIEPADWTASIDYLTSLGLVQDPVTAEDVLEVGLLPAGG
ncbi:MAG TPA: ABC transporter substrate-binding protein [Candidatus Limnocylindrales bacterium]|nr:ABC transporter substrate-binding protein [Candidatus Limnocylindrales bacterium]